ncbi:hypothetical protein AB0K00_39775 [Dactylosporangium sp. NPDC049525]|uniref:hypothetical protein n=1 Tax=Dactylosporangium sp. NPDC049525 TaxID=3154730 RepID=UPI00342D0B31
MCTAAISAFGVGRIDAVRSSLLAATGGNAGPSATAPASPALSPSPSPGSAKVLRTAGGNIVARCDANLTWADYLSPALGFHVENAQQGPGKEYRVTFKTDGKEVRVVVRCKDLTPEADVTLG